MSDKITQDEYGFDVVQGEQTNSLQADLSRIYFDDPNVKKNE